MTNTTSTLDKQKKSINSNHQGCGLPGLQLAGLFLIALFLTLQVGAQTLQVNYQFDDSGTAVTNSASPTGAPALNLYNYAGVLTDMHGAIGSGLNGSKALDFSVHLVQGNSTPQGPNAQITNQPSLGLGAVSNFTTAFWFKLPSNPGSGSGRLVAFGTNLVQSGAVDQFGAQFQSANQLQIVLNNNGNNITFGSVGSSFPIGSWQFVALTYNYTGTSTNLMVYWGSPSASPVLQSSNSPVVGKGFFNFGTSGAIFVGNDGSGPGQNRGFSGWMDNIQFYTGAGSATFVSNIWATTLPLPAIKADQNSGADVGNNAIMAITVPTSATAGGPLTITLTSDNPSVVANDSVVLPTGVTTTNKALPVLAQGVANVIASASGLGSAGTRVVGLNESGLINRWVGDDYISANNWTDRVSQVVATINGNSQATAIAGAFGSHTGVSEVNNANTITGNGFTVAAGQAFGGLTLVTNMTIAVAFKPTAAGPAQSGYYNDANILGYDVGGSGQQDFGIGWGGNDAGAGGTGGREVDCGIGRAGGDSRVLSPNGLSLALNVTHTAVMQVNSVNPSGAALGIQVLFVDGVQVAGNENLTLFAVNTNHTIPVLSTMYGNSPYGALPGSIAEIRFYTNALVDAAGLSAYLKNTYAGVLPITMTASPAAAQPGSNVVITVTIPSGASQTGPFAVTLTSDNTSVVGNTNITFPTGVTTTNVTMQVLIAGGATLTASGTGVGPASLTIIGLAPRTILDVLRASSLPNQMIGIDEGNDVSTWVGESNVVTAYTGTASPTFHTNATLAGTPSVKFTKSLTQNLGVPSGNNPINGLTNFSVVAVVRAASLGVGSGTAWYGMTGIADAEVGGNTYDWGLELDVNGYLNFGTGVPTAINGDVNDSLAATNYTAVDSLFHVVVGSFDQLNGVKQITLDNKTTITEPSSSQHFSAGSIQRVAAALSIGENKYGNYLDGEIVELRFYNGALTSSEATNIIAGLKSDYSLIWPDQSLITVTPSPAAAEVGLTVNANIGIPLGFNNSSSVTVTVTSTPPGIVTFNGAASTNLVFAVGTTNIKTIAVQLVGVGSATLTGSGTGLIAGNATVSALPIPTTQEIFRASDLPSQISGIANGDSIPTWLGSLNSTPANSGGANAPLFHANATPSGAPAVQFVATSNAFFNILPANDPSAGLTNFSVAAVFRATAPASTSFVNWWDMAGLLDNEENGFPADWGLEVDTAGNVIFGTGSANNQVTVNYNTVGSAFHVVVASYDTLTGVQRIQVDDQPQVSQSGLIGSPRIAGTLPLRIGQNQYGDYLNGDIAELRIYNGALSSAEIASTITNLKTNYSLSFSGDYTSVSLSVIAISANTIQISWPANATALGYALESTTNLLNGWSASGLTVGTSGGNSVVTDTTTNSTRFYRLHKP
jgi:hypothetical protein